ncbi:MAG: MopE-related protein, partial [Bacteroidota bacterium]
LSGLFTDLSAGTYTVIIKVFGINGVCEESVSVTVGAGNAVVTCYLDGDGDGYGAANEPTVEDCVCPTDYFTAAELNGNTSNDCDDGNGAVNPGAAEVCDGLDNDCDGVVPADEIDGDGDGFSPCEGDCDDSDAAVNPGAAEVCNGIDDNCDGTVDEGVGTGLTFNGNVSFGTQADVDAWLGCYSVINGSVTIIGTDITDLGPLGNLTEITGNLIVQTTGVTDLSGLDNLTTIGGSLTIYFNSLLASLDGLDALSSVGSILSIYYNFVLEDCCAIYGLLNSGGVGGTVLIFFNAVGCNSAAEVLAGCTPFTGGNPPSFTVQQEAGCTACPYQGGMSVYPNPVTTELTVEVASAERAGILRITDIMGRTVIQQQLAIDQYRIQLNVSHLNSGVYMVTVQKDGDEMMTKRVVVE